MVTAFLKWYGEWFPRDYPVVMQPAVRWIGYIMLANVIAAAVLLCGLLLF